MSKGITVNFALKLVDIRDEMTRRRDIQVKHAKNGLEDESYRAIAAAWVRYYDGYLAAIEQVLSDLKKL